MDLISLSPIVAIVWMLALILSDPKLYCVYYTLTVSVQPLSVITAIYSTSMGSHLVYDRDFLLQLNPYPNQISGLLNKDGDDLTFDIQTLSLSSLRRGRGKRNRRHRGKRGGRRKQRHAINFSSSGQNIPRIVTNRGNSTDDQPPASAKCAVLNARSVCNKAALIQTFLIDHDIDVLVIITETWLTEGDDVTPRQLLPDPDGYSFISVPRSGRGGGLGIVAKSHINIKQRPPQLFETFESAEFVLRAANMSMLLVAVYRPPPSTQNGLSRHQFVNEFTSGRSCH